jgi:hypothetical protein
LKTSLEALFYLAEAHGMTINKGVYEYINRLASQHKYFTTELDLSRHAFYNFSRDVMSRFGGCNIQPRQTESLSQNHKYHAQQTLVQINSSNK